MARRVGRVLFPYVVVFAFAVSLIAGFGMMANLHGWETLLWAIGGCLVLGAGMFTFFEVRRIAGISLCAAEQARDEEEADRSVRHAVIVQAPTGEAYPHHEDHAESAGFDQGQLTSRSPDSTPLVGKLIQGSGARKHQSLENSSPDNSKPAPSASAITQGRRAK